MGHELKGYIKKRFLIRLIINFTAAVFIAVTVVGLAFSRLYLSTAKENLTNEYERAVQRKLAELEIFEQEVGNVYKSLLSEDNIIDFLNARSWDAYTEYQSIKVLNRLNHLYPRIHSIHLYNPYLDYHVSSFFSGGYGRDFEDGDFAAMLLADYLVQRRTLATEAGEEQVVTFCYPLIRRNDDPGLGQRKVIINCYDTFDIAREITDESHFYLIQDRSGRLFGGRRESGGDVLPPLSGDRGSVFFHHVNRELILSYQRSDKFQFTLINVNDYQDFVGRINRRRNQILWITFSALLLSSFFIVLFSRKMYTPVKTLLNRMRGMISQESGERAGDMTYLIEGFAEISRQMETLKREHENDSLLIRQHLLSRLVKEDLSPGETDQLLGELKSNPGEGDFQVILVSPDYMPGESRENREICEQAILRVLLNSLRDIESREVFILEKGTVCALVGNCLFLEDDEIRKRCLIVRDEIFSLFRVNCTLGIGAPADRASGIHDSYLDGIYCLNHRLTLGPGQVIDGASLSRDSADFLPYPAEMEEKLVGEMRNNDRAGFCALLKELGTRLKGQEYNNAHFIMVQLSLQLIKVHNQLARNHGYDNKKELKDYSELLRDISYYDEWSRWMERLFSRHNAMVEEVTRNRQKEDHRKLIDRVKAFIGENYSDPNLYAETLAARFSYSTNYFSKLFREAEGVTLNDYLRKVRVDRAKDLLRKNKRTAVKNVAGQVGFTNTNYFYHLFKKETGLTPAAYKSLGE